MVAANPNQNGNPNQDTGVKPHPERIARKLKIFFLLNLQVLFWAGIIWLWLRYLNFVASSFFKTSRVLFWADNLKR